MFAPWSFPGRRFDFKSHSKVHALLISARRRLNWDAKSLANLSPVIKLFPRQIKNKKQSSNNQSKKPKHPIEEGSEKHCKVLLSVLCRAGAPEGGGEETETPAIKVLISSS